MAIISTHIPAETDAESSRSCCASGAGRQLEDTRLPDTTATVMPTAVSAGYDLIVVCYILVKFDRSTVALQGQKMIV